MTLDGLNLTNLTAVDNGRMAQASQVLFVVIRPVVRRRCRHRVFGIADVAVVRRVSDGIDEQRRRGQRDQVPSVESF